MLKCGIHKCTSSCHQLSDHSKVLCKAGLAQQCSSGHKQSWQCHAGPPSTCYKCERDRKESEKRARIAVEEKLKRDEKDRRHQKELERIQEETEQVIRKMKDARLDAEQQSILAQKQKDLEAAKERAAKAKISHQQISSSSLGISNNNAPSPGNLPPGQSSSIPPTPKTSINQQSEPSQKIQNTVEHNKSLSKIEWQRQKNQEGAHNPAIDKIMEMIGLEDVKAQVLRIKAKVETSIRQDTDLSKERLGLVLLGNPGTGILLLHFRLPLC